MQTLQIHTQQSAASRASAVTRFTPSKGCRSVFAQLPVRPVAVHGSRQVQQVAPASTVHTEQPKTAVKPVKTLKQHVVELVQTGAKAAAVLGVAVALVSCGGTTPALHLACSPRYSNIAGLLSHPAPHLSHSLGGALGHSLYHVPRLRMLMLRSLLSVFDALDPNDSGATSSSQ